MGQGKLAFILQRGSAGLTSLPPVLMAYDSMPDLGEIEVYLGSKFQSCFIDDFGMSGSLLQYWKYVTQI